MSKFKSIIELLEIRIRRGDYAVAELPAEGKLAKDIGVARLTARKAVNHLVDKGVLFRLPNGRATIRRKSRLSGIPLQLAFLAPTYVNSNDTNLCRIAAKKAASAAGANLRSVEYVSWDDPSIESALRGFDGVFFKPWTEFTPQWIIESIKKSPASVFVLDQDLSEHGVRSLCPFPPVFLQRLLDHLAGLGHKRIDCFNVQPIESVIAKRIEQWNIWKAAHGMSGELWSMESDSPLKASYDSMLRLLDSAPLSATAFLCTTGPCAIGAMRALHERRISIAKDVSICAVNDEGLGRYVVPTLTALEMPDLVPFMSICIQWMARGEKKWVGPLRMQPEEIPMFIGESTGPAPDREKPA